MAAKKSPTKKAVKKPEVIKVPEVTTVLEEITIPEDTTEVEETTVVEVFEESKEVEETKEPEKTEEPKTVIVPKAEKMVKVCPRANHACFIGGTRYNFIKGKTVTVPIQVKQILSKSDLLAPL